MSLLVHFVYRLHYNAADRGEHFQKLDTYTSFHTKQDNSTKKKEKDFLMANYFETN